MIKNIAVVGCGHWGKNLVRNFAELGSLKAICDPEESVAERFAKKFKVSNLSFNDILIDNSIEGVVLAVPASIHAQLAIEVIKANKHVYVEKPLAMNKSEADKMISLSKQHGVHLMVGHLLQYHPIFQKLKQLVQSNKLGSLSYMYSNRLSFGKVRSEEDVIWSFAPHDMSMLLSLAGKEPKSIITQSSKVLQKEIADTAIIHMAFDSKLKAHIHVSWIHPYKEHKLVICGDKAMAVFDDTKSWNEKLAIYEHKINFIGGDPSLTKADPKYIIVEQSEPLKNECQHFIDVVEGNSKPLTDGMEGLKVLNMLTSASDSIGDLE
tara:strand:+ start:1059 stop:2024 length:966 start_codon:yes stop_codon:yes gene_type:complete